MTLLTGKHGRIGALLAILLLGDAVSAQPFGREALAQPLSWTDWADLALASDVVLTGAVHKVSRLNKREAPDVPLGQVRALVQVQLQSVMKAPSIMPEGAAWLWQGNALSGNKVPFKTKQFMLAFAKPLSGGAKPEIQALELVSAAGMQPWSPEAEAIVREVLLAAQKPGARGLMVTNVTDGFRSEGDIPGISESQFFLASEGGNPLTLVVRRHPERQPEVLASAGELVSAGDKVQPRTLLWRGLACGLPRELPANLMENVKLAADYRIALAVIGDCGRTVAPPVK